MYWRNREWVSVCLCVRVLACIYVCVPLQLSVSPTLSHCISGPLFVRDCVYVVVLCDVMCSAGGNFLSALYFLSDHSLVIMLKLMTGWLSVGETETDSE